MTLVSLSKKPELDILVFQSTVTHLLDCSPQTAAWRENISKLGDLQLEPAELEQLFAERKEGKTPETVAKLNQVYEAVTAASR